MASDSRMVTELSQVLSRITELHTTSITPDHHAREMTQVVHHRIFSDTIESVMTKAMEGM